MMDANRDRYSFARIAELIVRNTADDADVVICITGPSCVGKTTFAKLLSQVFGEHASASVISTDSYLKQMYRGVSSFRKSPKGMLTPDFFDWERLREHIDQLRLKAPVKTACYERGVGWKDVLITPARVLIVEGLFLDSTAAAEFLEYDIMVKLYAEDSLIGELRTKRDAYYRKTSRVFTRTEAESIHEIKNTLRAYHSYQKAPYKSDYLDVLLDADFYGSITAKSEGWSE